MPVRKLYRCCYPVAAAFALLVFASCASPEFPDQSRLPDGVTVEHLKSYGPLQFRVMVKLAGIDAGDLDLSRTVDLYRVGYPSVDPAGEDGHTSGLMAIPRSIEEYRGIVSWQHGTITSQDDLPSAPGLYQGVFASLLFSMGGYVTVAPDYYGYDTGAPAYLDALSEAQSVLNLVRTARDLIADDESLPAAPEGRFLVGFSQGGHATLSAIHYWSEELGAIAGAASLSGPVAFAEPAGVWEQPLSFENALYGDATSHTYYLSFVSASYSDWYGHPLSEYVSERHVEPVSTLFDGRHDADEIDEWILRGGADGGVVQSRELFTDRFTEQFASWRAGQRTDPPWLVERLRHNGVTSCLDEYARNNNPDAAAMGASLFPLRIYAGTLDNDVPPTEALLAQAMWGDRIELILLEGADHEEVVMTGLVDVRRWFDELSGPVE